MQKRVPIGKIVRLVAKAARYSKGGFSAEERRDLGVSLLELASAILEEAASAGFTIKTRKVEPIATTDYPTPATRPAYSVLNTDKISACLPFTIPAWRDSLKNMLQEYATCADCS